MIRKFFSKKSSSTRSAGKQFKGFIIVFLPLILLSNIIIYFFMQYDLSIHRKKLFVQEEKKVEILKRSAENCIRSVIADLLYLSLHPSFKEMVNKNSRKHSETLTKLFIDFSRKTGLYDQIRFIDTTGQERIRVNYRTGNPNSVPEILLQNKSHRYYFRETIELNAGKIFMSPMDLNVENNRLEKPLKPMIRFGTPVFNIRGEKCGILIINFMCSELFRTLEAESGKLPEYTVMLNRSGFWLKGLNSSEEWGFVIKERERYNIKNSKPLLWHKMKIQDGGQLYIDNTLYTYGTVYPLIRNLGQSSPAYKNSPGHLPASDYFWKIATIIPEDKLVKLLDKTYRRWMLIFLISSVLVTFTSWRLSVSTRIKHDAMQTLKAAHSDLESKVKERTLEILDINKKLEKEIYEKQQSEKKIMHLNSVISAIRNINKQIVKIKDYRKLLQASCSILTQTRGYYSAWIGLIQRDESIDMVATSGVEGYESVKTECITGKDFPQCINSLKGSATITVIDPIKKHCDCPFSKGQSDAAGIASKLIHHHKLYGYIVISVASDFISNDEELKLIQELSEDLGYALYSLEQEKSREIAEQALKVRTLELTQRLKELNCLFEISKIVENPGIRISQIIQKIVDIIPDSMKFPGRVSAQVAYAGRNFRTSSYEESSCRISENLYTGSQQVGVIEAHMTPAGGEDSGEHFTDDEENLLKVVAERISKIIEHSLTYRKNRVIEEALKESEEKYRMLIQNADEAIFITIDGLIKFPNPKTEQLLAATRKQLLNEKFSHFVHHEDLPYYFHEMHSRENSETVNMKFRIVNNSNTELIVELSSVSVTWEHQEAHLNMLRDVTREKKMEDTLRQSQKMEAIGTLAGGIAHDFNNILSAIFGYTELSLSRLEKKAYLENNLKKILKAGTRARDLIQQILTFSRRSEMEFRPIRLSSIIREVAGLLRASLPSTIDIKLNIDSQRYIMGDHVQLHQILMNLATNSGYAMRKKGGVLSINLQNRKEPVENGVPGIIEMVIADTGEGIPNEIQSRIFDPFFTTKPQGKGTGMGLSVVHGIVKSHEGYMVVNSQPGEGTIITIQFPSINKPISKRFNHRNNVKGGEETILFVDDEPAITEIGKSILTSIGYSVTTFTDSREALEHFSKAPNSFDLLITDKTMPNLTGEDLAIKFKELRKDIPVIICTGFTGSGSDNSELKDLVDVWLEKPILKAQMAEAVRKTLDKK